MTWRNGRELNTATVGGKTYSYEYDVNGLRTRKTNSDGGYTQYYIVDGLTVAEQRFTSTGAEKYTLRYLYDESNSPVGFGIQYPGGTTWTNYYFAKNLQGDVIALYLWNGTSTGTQPALLGLRGVPLELAARSCERFGTRQTQRPSCSLP